MSSTLSKAVKFRALSDELSTKEYNKFLANFVTKCGRNTILKWLFTQFTSINDNYFNTQKLDDAINDISNIIQSRECKPNQVEPDKTTIDSLPGELYGEIGSYLKDKEYIAFSKTNRSIYIGCNTPNCLKYLDLISVEDYSCINLQKYPQIEHLKINLNKFNQLQLPSNGITICNHLKQLTLDGDCQTDIDIDEFLKQNAVNINNLAQLNLDYFGVNIYHLFDSQTFCRLLSKFRKITDLRLRYISCDRLDIDNQKLTELLPNLQGFECTGALFHTPFIEAYSNKLKALTFWDDEEVDIPSNASFNNLQDLIISTPRVSTVNTILKTAKNLRRVKLQHLWAPRSFTDSDWKNTMYKLLSEQKLLKYLEIRATFDKFADISNGLESALYDNDECYNDIKIKLEFRLHSTINVRDIFVYLLRILNQLQSSDTVNFMLIFDLDKDGALNEEKWNKEKDKFINKNSLQYEIYTEQRMIVITNKQCTINGYLESWIMDQE